MRSLELVESLKYRVLPVILWWSHLILLSNKCIENDESLVL
jgi:hypothetical protein